MYACVKYLEGPQKDKTDRVPVSKINYEFKDYNDYNKMKKYSVQYRDDKYYKAIVIFFDETIEAINARVSKRVVIPRVKDLDTASDQGSQKLDNSLMKKSKSIVEQKKPQKPDGLKLKKYASILSLKTDNLKKILNQKNEADMSSKSSAKAQIPNTSHSETSTKADYDKENSTHTNKSLEDNSSSTLLAADGVEPSLINTDKPASSSSTGLKIKSIEVEGLSTKESSQLILKLRDESKKLQKKCTTLEKDKEKLQQKYKKLKIEIEDLNKKYTKLHDLNIKLQENILETLQKKKVDPDPDGIKLFSSLFADLDYSTIKVVSNNAVPISNAVACMIYIKMQTS